MMTLSEFNEKFTGTLNIVLTEEPVPIAPDTTLLNVRVPENSSIVSLRLHSSVYDENNVPTFRDPTPQELDVVVIDRSSLRMRGLSGDIVEHRPMDGETFKVYDLLFIVEE